MGLARYCLATFLLYASVATASSGPIKIATRGDRNADYAIGMIKLGLEKMGNPYELEITERVLSSMRMRTATLEGEIDIIWTATNNEIEENFIPVRVPLYKGLLGFRILIIHKDNINMFDDVQTMEDAKKFTYGQGKGWTDTTILRASGLEVITTAKYHGLFHMADGKRFDAYPRGVHEPWNEIKDRPELELTVDENLMFVYKMPYYLVVSPNRPDVAETIEKGLLKAIDDGSFDKIFFNNDVVKLVLDKANMDKRRTFNLTNPDLPPLTPLNNPKLWFDPMSVSKSGLANH